MSEKMIDMTEGFGLNMPKAKLLVVKYKPHLQMEKLLLHV